MKIPELKEELKKRGQPLLGNKGVLVELLLSVLAKNIPVVNGNKPKPNKSDKNKSGGGMKWFPDTAYWRVLKPKMRQLMSQIMLLSKILMHLLLQRKMLNTYQQSMTLIPISNDQSLQVSKMLYVLVRHHFNTHISWPFLTVNRRKYRVNRRGDVINDKSGKELFDTETKNESMCGPCIYFQAQSDS